MKNTSIFSTPRHHSFRSSLSVFGLKMLWARIEAAATRGSRTSRKWYSRTAAKVGAWIYSYLVQVSEFHKQRAP